MNPTLRFGRIAGIPIGANWSWVLVVGLIGWSLGAGVFPDSNPGLSDTTYAVMAVVAVPVFFISLLLHELGHALRARREGVEIEGITLWMFGGVAQFKGTFPSAGAEFRIAIAGPLVSLALGVLFVATSALPGLPSSVDGVLSWLGYINLTLLVFNLLPAFPLDGGRVLRSALWQRKGDLAAATEAAAAVGRGFAHVFIALGLFTVLAGGGLGGLWIAFIGWFLLMASGAEVGATVQSKALEGITVGHVMVAEPFSVDADLSVQAFIDDVVFAHRHTTYPVMQDGKPVGLVVFRDIAALPKARWATERVGDHIMPLDRLLVVHASDPVGPVWPALVSTDPRRALVVDERGDLAGLLSVTDVARVLEVAHA